MILRRRLHPASLIYVDFYWRFLLARLVRNQGTAHRFALPRPFLDASRTGSLRANFAWFWNRAAGRPNSRLKARLKDGSDS
jgi:hypothetical protein